ncbi:Protein of uncharacterised function (DUF2807) [Legionella lansingensis]|uniref:Putative auto-transporter adhesin head GIN domain-containing protein n=1 Tax=Legionella lansingensis TaxID=45067 RepID=A0A0W0VRX3_9GAMM|nr:DUF2807 domain-containing protein [Legionella lansingensis]KTD22733.1 hypothetical protein Llan_1084 [Legionella lansingensis]SNV56701.1 Protein of uncharacterised function (DUF2807) [Legionella lansingensis]
MFMRFFLFIFIVLSTASCHKRVAAIHPTTLKALQNRQLTAFNRVTVDGNINVNLHTGYSRPQVILRGPTTDLLQVKVGVHGNHLLIYLAKGYPRNGVVSVDIRGQYLNAFTYRGSGFVTGNRLRSGLMDISITNPGPTTLGGQISLRKLTVAGGGQTQITGISSQHLQLSIVDNSRVQLAGVMNITHLDLDEKAWLAMYWVKSHALTIRGRGQAFVQLAGIVDKLDVELCDRAHFNGRYLRAKRAFVKTHDKAVADIAAVNRQHTLATDASDIYFYNIPTMKTDFMAYQGSVLDMRDWDPWDPRDYDRYNK